LSDARTAAQFRIHLPPVSRAALLPATLAALSFLGIGISSYLTYVHWTDKPVACTALADCERVATSEYADIGGVPVAFLGLLAYIGLFAVAAVWLYVYDRGLTWPSMTFWGLSLGGVIYSAYLTYLELFVIDAICMWCVASAIVLAVLFVLSTAEVLRMSRHDEEPDWE
jgi:uncharacterized membrane protein